ncbi:MAG: hypothetical protein AAFY30_00670 [Cyanobacteria bacterium J06642_12]
MTLVSNNPGLLIERGAGSVWVAWALGTVLVIAMQLTFAAFGVAVAATASSFRLGSSNSDSTTTDFPTVAVVGGAALGTLLGVNVTLFAASFAAAKLLAFANVASGAVLGLGIWAGYLLLCTWASYSAANTALSAASALVFGGLNRLIRTIGKGLQGSDTELSNGSSSSAKSALANSDRMARIQQQLDSLRQAIEDASAQTNFAEARAVTSRFWNWLSGRKAQEPERFKFKTLDRDSIRREIQSFLDHQPAAIADADIPAMIAMLEDVALQFQESIQEESVRDESLSNKVVQEEGEQDSEQASQSTELVQAVSGDSDTMFDRVGQLFTKQRSQGFSVWDSLSDIDIDSLVQMLVSKVDLSDLDIESAWQMVQSLTSMKDARGQSSEHRVANVTVLDLEHYLSELYPWQLNTEYLTATMPEVLRDPDANPVQVFELLSAIDATSLSGNLESHPANLSPDRVRDLSLHLADICSQTLETAKADSVRHAISELDRILLRREQLRTESQTLVEASNAPEEFEFSIDDLLNDVEATYNPQLVEPIFEEIAARSPLQWSEILAADASKNSVNWNDSAGERLSSRISAAVKQRLSDLRTRQKRLEAAIETIDRKLQSYLRYTAIDRLDPPRVEDKLDRLMTAVSL